MSISAIAYRRHLLLMDIIKERREASVQELSQSLDVSTITVRRDLEYLSRRGMLDRYHGGARLIRKNNRIPERGFSEKGIINTEEKRAIVRKGIELLDLHDVIFLNSGTTTLFFVETLQGKSIKVFTNNASIIGCHKNPDTEVIILGGEYREQSQSFVGIITLDIIQSIRSNKTFLGVNGISVEKGLTTTVQQECSINKAMIENTDGPVIVLADHAKIGRVSNFVSNPLNKVDILVTGKCCPEEDIRQFEEKGIQVITAD